MGRGTNSKAARIPSIVQARALLGAADEPHLVAYVALCLFGGFRDSEARRLQWENLLWDKGEIELKAAPGRKEGTGRFVPLEGNLRAWLLPLRCKGTVCDLGDNEIRVALMRIRKRADKALELAKLKSEATLAGDWQRDLLRHGAASCWGAIHGIKKACGWLGHGEEVHKAHYRTPVPTETAKALFQIVPTDAPANITAIAS